MENKPENKKPSRSDTLNIPEATLAQYRDHLTGAFNRAFLFQIVPQRLQNASQNKYKIALFMIDLDNFKQINDSHGHPVGDKVLKGIADSLTAVLRDNDYLVRYAGDEFLIILEDITLEVATSVAKRLLESVRKFKIEVKEKKVTQTTSMGFAIFNDDAKTLEELIERADEALYLAKKRNKNNFAYFREVSLDQISLRAGMNSFPCHEFIDRRKEISLAKKVINDFQKSGTARAIIACGESGIGKSRMLKETSTIFQEQGKDAIFATAYQKNSLSPYFLLIKTFNTYLINNLLNNRKDILSLLRGIDDKKRNVLSHFLSCLQDIFQPQGTKPGDAATIFDAFAALVNVLAAKKRGLFLGIDNIQYSDLATLDFFNFILEKKQRFKLFLFLNILDPIPAGVYNPSAITNVIVKVGSRTNTDVIMLSRFSHEETHQMINAIFPKIEATDDFSDILFDVTKGHPFFIEELLKYLLEKAFIYFEDEKWRTKKIFKDSLPKSIDEVMRQRLERLDPEIKETILISSVIGEEINPEVLGKIKSLKEGDILDILDKARKLKIIKDEENGFGFLNITAKEATLNEIPDAQRKGIYDQVSDVLMDTYKDNIEAVSFQLANLFNKTEDIEKLNKFSKIIAERSSNIFDPQEVLKYMEDLTEVEEEEGLLFSAKEIQDDHISSAGEFLRLFQSALKDFKLYPAGSKIRDKVVEHICKSLNGLFETYPVINMSEVEKSLILNKRRITSRLAKFVDIDSIIRFLIDRDIKSVIFLKDITDEEIANFLELLVMDPEDITSQGKWKDILTEKNLTHISVNKATYLTPQSKVAASPIRDKLEGAMITDFILGKISGKDLKDMNLAAILEDNPQVLSDELLKAAEMAKKLDKHSDKLDVIFKGIQKLDTFAKKDIDEAGANKKTQENIEEKISDVFKEFDTKTKAHLIRKSEAPDKSMGSIIKSLDDSYVEKIVTEAFNSGVSLWGLEKLLSKLKTVHDYHDEKLQAALKKSILPHLGTQEEKQFMQGKGTWETLPLEVQVNEILKMDMTDLDEIAQSSLSYVLEKLIVSSESEKFEKVFAHFQKLCLEFPNKLNSKIISIYKESLKKLYSLAQERKKVFDALKSIISTVKEKTAKESFDFTSDLLLSVTDTINVFNFKGENNLEKVQFIYSLWKTIDDCRYVIGEEAAQSWFKQINFQKIAEDLFNAYVQNAIIVRKGSPAQEAFYKLLSFSLDKIVGGLAKKIANVSDPFEKFVALNKLKGFFSGLKSSELEKFIAMVLNSFSSGDVCDILAYIKNDKLNDMFQRIYYGADYESQEKILAAIDRLNVKESLDFLRELLTRRENPDLHKKVTKLYAKLKSR